MEFESVIKMSAKCSNMFELIAVFLHDIGLDLVNLLGTEYLGSAVIIQEAID
jgi:hypothetical protein